MPQATDKATTTPAPEVKAPERTEWVVSGITIRKGNNDYKFYEGDAKNYRGALGGANLTEEKATERATRIAMKLEQSRAKAKRN